MIDVNLTAAFELSHEAAKVMIPQNSGKLLISARCFLIWEVSGHRLIRNKTCAGWFH
jgi:NAD(P)-dependent dehydrogenase (short-subunit alcohol dehydrogenase family)